MDASELAGHDLNLLVMLHALLTEAHVGKAGARIGRSQPAMSRALARLRDMFDDPLLVRAKSGMQLTTRALELLPELEAVMSSVAALLQPPHFEPATATGTIRLAAPDLVTYMLAPALLRELAIAAPGLDLEICGWTPDWRAQLDSGAIDLTVGLPAGTEHDLHSRPLIEARWACLLRADHPALADAWTVERFASLDHLEVTLAHPFGGELDAALAERGLSRRVALRVPYPALSPLLIAETDLVLTTNEWVAEKFARQIGVVVRPLPLPAAPLSAPIVWHARSHLDPVNRWLRELISRLARPTNST